MSKNMQRKIYVKDLLTMEYDTKTVEQIEAEEKITIPSWCDEIECDCNNLVLLDDGVQKIIYKNVHGTWGLPVSFE